MNLNQIAKLLCRKEGKKKQVTIGNMREVLRCLIELEAEMIKQGAPTPIDYIHRKAWILAHKGKAEFEAEELTVENELHATLPQV